MKDNGMPFAKKLEIVTLAGLLCLLPFTGMTSVKEILFFSLGGLSLAGRLPDFRNMYRESLHYNTLHILMIASSVLALVSLLHAIDPSYTFREAVTKMPKQYLLYVFAFFLVRDAGAEKVPWILYPLALSATVMSLYACYQFYENSAFFVNRVTGFTGLKNL